VHDSRRTRLVLGVLLIIAIALITLDFRDGGASPVRTAGSDIFGPIERVTHDVTNPVSSLFDSITGGPSAQNTIAGLQLENAQLRAELSSAQLSQAAKQQLAQLLQMDAGGYRIVAANVIAAGGDYSDTVTLDVGRNDGITPNETVLNGSGFVGTVTGVSEDTSTVLLADDASSTLGVQLADSGQIGSVTGTGKAMTGTGLLRLTLFDANTVLQVGEQVNTYASVEDQPEVPGVPVGTIVSLQRSAGSLTATALVRPAVDFTALGVVGIVIQVPKHNPRVSILPRPAPTVTITVTPSASSGTANGAASGGAGTGGAGTGGAGTGGAGTGGAGTGGAGTGGAGATPSASGTGGG
jgi:rod shape-determining protein MreC